MNEEKKSYYAIIPADVRYDPDLTPNAKLLYGEITSLTNEKGYCWASNKYFTDLYKVDTSTLTRWLQQLKNKGYITIEFIYKEGTKQIANRYIKINGRGICKNAQGYMQNCIGGICKNAKDNNKYKNNKYEYINKKDLPDWFNKEIDAVKPTEEEQKEIDSLLNQFM